MFFTDRTDAGHRLGTALANQLHQQSPVVLGLPRGGVVVAYEVARSLRAPLDCVVVRKLGVPYQPELAMGAIGEEGVRVLNQDVIRTAGVTEEQLSEAEERERQHLVRRASLLRAAAPPVDLAGTTAVIVDDGMATGATARVACRVARCRGAAQVVVALPTGPADLRSRLGSDADKVVCLTELPGLAAVGDSYGDFGQVDDELVVRLLREARGNRPTAADHVGEP